MRSFLIIYFAGFLISCSQPEERDSLIQEEQLELSPSKEFNFEDFVEDVTYIKLENNPESIFSYANKIIFRRGKIYIFDRNGQPHIYVFSKEGDFITRIGSIGRGPQEYIRLRDFDVDVNGNIYLYDRQNMKMIIYDSTASFVSKQSTEDIRADGFKKLSNGDFIFSISKENPESSLNDYHLLLTDGNYKIQKRMLPMDPYFFDNYLAMDIIKKSASHIYYNKPIDDRIYLLNDMGNKVEKCLKLQFENPVKKEYINDFQLLLNPQSNIYMDYLISSPFITEHYIFGTAEHAIDQTRFFFIYKRGNHSSYTINIVPESYTHRNINFPLTVLGDSAIVTLLEPSMFEYDIRKGDLTSDLVVHLENGGFILVIHHLKRSE